MKNVLLLLVLLFTVLGCAESYDGEIPRIVKIDPSPVSVPPEVELD